MTERQPTESIIGVIGGSGLYELFEPGTAHAQWIDTPYGPTSSAVSTGRLAGRRVAFLTRHGSGHTVAPHKIRYRANVWALASLGVRAIITTSAVGSLSADMPPDTFVVPDQLIDRTWGRDDTFYDGESVQHVPLADPFCPDLRRVALGALVSLGETFSPTGTSVVIQGPRFSTRAESAWFRNGGAHIVNMTQYPEVALAAELNVGLVNLSFVTDKDSGNDGPTESEASDASVNSALVLARMAAADPRIRAAIEAIVRAIPTEYSPRALVSPEAVTRLLARRSAGGD